MMSTEVHDNDVISLEEVMSYTAPRQYPAYTFTGDLSYHRRFARPSVIEEIAQHGLQPHGDYETVQLPFSTTIYAPNRRDAYDQLRGHVAFTSFVMQDKLVDGGTDGGTFQHWNIEHPNFWEPGNPPDWTVEWRCSGRLFITKADTRNWYRSDLLFGYDRQLDQYTEAQRGNPDSI